MKQVAQFKKVSFEQYAIDYCKCVGKEKIVDGTEVTSTYDSIQLPKRATTGSAGYDVHTPIGFKLKPGESITLPTGLRVKIEEGWVMGCFPRSSLGFKYRLQLDNTIGIIDSDYYGSKNEGHIMMQLTNDTHNHKTISVEQGDRIMQAIFLPFGITVDDNCCRERNGGLGSTGKGEMSCNI